MMSIKMCYSHVKELRLSGILKRHLGLKLQELNICDAEMLKWIKQASIV